MSREAEILLQEYVHAAEEHARLSESLRGPADAGAATRAYHSTIRALHALDEFDKEGRRRLKALLDHPTAHVRVCAATDLLELFPKEAEAVLEEVASGLGDAAFAATGVLREWRRGTLKIP